MLACNMVIVGNPQPNTDFSDFVGGVIIENLDDGTEGWAHKLGARLAEVAVRIGSKPS